MLTPIEPKHFYCPSCGYTKPVEEFHGCPSCDREFCVECILADGFCEDCTQAEQEEEDAQEAEERIPGATVGQVIDLLEKYDSNAPFIVQSEGLRHPFVITPRCFFEDGGDVILSA